MAVAWDGSGSVILNRQGSDRLGPLDPQQIALEDPQKFNKFKSTDIEFGEVNYILSSLNDTRVSTYQVEFH